MSKKCRRALAALIAGLSIPTGMIAAGAVANAAAPHHSAARPAIKVCGTGTALVRPSSIILTCADDGELAEHLHWSIWTRTSATASGIVTWRTGSAAPGSRRHWQSTEAQFTLLDPVSEPGGRVLFTRLHLHVTGSTPPGFIRNLTFDEAPVTAPAPRPLLPAGRKRATSAPSGTLGYADIEGFWIDAGGPPSVAETAAAITGAESSYYPGIIQPGVDYCGSGSDKAGWGLWQITCGNSVPAYGTDFQVLDPWNNAEAAVSKYNAASGFSPWSTYTSGAYQNYLQNVTPNTNLTDPGEYTQVNSTPPGTPASPPADPGSKYGPVLSGSLGPSAGSDSSKNLYAFWKGTDGGLWENNGHAPSGTWSGAHEVPGMGPLGSMPATAVSSSGNQFVFWQGTNGDLYEAYYDGSWHGPTEVTDSTGSAIGPMGSAPTASTDGTNTVYVFWQNVSDQGLEEASGNGESPLHFGAQHEISDMGTLGSAPAVTVDSSGQQYLFWKGTGSADLWFTEWLTSGGWQPTQDLGGGPLA
jgi:hypothetical protein